MRKSKIEKYFFNFLKFLPFVVFGFYCLFNLFLNINLKNTAMEPTQLYDYLSACFTFGKGAGFMTFYEPITYFLGLFGYDPTSVVVKVVSSSFNWLIVVELIHLLFDVVIFIPKACRKLIEKGM